MINFFSFLIFLLPWEEINKYYLNNVNTLYAEFDEILISDGERSEYKGKLWANRKGYLKFLITEPDSQLLFVRKDKVFLYDFDDKKETEIFSSPYLPDFFLFNFENLYSLKEEKERGDTLIYVFERKDSTYVYDLIKLFLPHDDKIPYKLNIISSSLSVEYVIFFKKFIINPILSEDIFKKVQIQRKERK